MTIHCLDGKPTPDFSGTRVIDTSNPLKKTGTPPVLNKTSLPLRVDVTPPLNFLVGGARFHFFRLRVDSAQISCETYLDISQTLRLLVRKTPLLGILDCDQGRVNSPLR